MLGLHYVPGSHGGNIVAYRGQNGVAVTRRNSPWDKTGAGARQALAGVIEMSAVARRGKFLNCQKIFDASHGREMNVTRRGERNTT